MEPIRSGESVSLGGDGSGTYTLSGSGLLTAQGNEIHRHQRNGRLHAVGRYQYRSGDLLLAENAGSSGTYNLNGGLLSLAGLTQGSGSATFNFSGGTFQALSSFSTSVPIVLGTAGSNRRFRHQRQHADPRRRRAAAAAA